MRSDVELDLYLVWLEDPIIDFTDLSVHDLLGDHLVRTPAVILPQLRLAQFARFGLRTGPQQIVQCRRPPRLQVEIHRNLLIIGIRPPNTVIRLKTTLMKLSVCRAMR